MRKFNYKAKNKATGKMISGVVQADTEGAAGRLLIEQGLIPEKIVAEDENSFIYKLKNRVTTKDRIVFTRQFATLLGAGLPLASCLKTLSEQTGSAGMRKIVEEIRSNVEAGKSLSESLKAYPNVFNTVYLSLVSAGEMSGTLDIALAELATQDEKDAAMISQIKSSLIYPAILLAVIIGVVIFMIFNVVPEVENLYESMDKELPGITVFLVAFMNSIINGWWAYLVVIAGIVLILRAFMLSTTGKKFFALVKLNIPAFGGLFKRLYMMRFCKTMKLLLETGVSMLDSLKISANATANLVVEEVIMKARDGVRSGKPLSKMLEDQDYILPLVPQMLGIGEESGKVDEMLGRAAKVYEDELDIKIKNISTLIEPVLLIVMAGLVGVVLAGTLMPIYSLVSSI